MKHLYLDWFPICLPVHNQKKGGGLFFWDSFWQFLQVNGGITKATV